MICTKQRNILQLNWKSPTNITTSIVSHERSISTVSRLKLNKISDGYSVPESSQLVNQQHSATKKEALVTGVLKYQKSIKNKQTKKRFKGQSKYHFYGRWHHMKNTLPITMQCHLIAVPHVFVKKSRSFLFPTGS